MRDIPSVFVYGPPGSGKTTLGSLLAQDLDMPFRDLDAVIEAESGMTIPAIFAREGEAGFRRREKDALLGLLGDAPGVIALGGGALLDGEVRRLVEAHGRVLCLQADLQTLSERLAAAPGKRPLLANGAASLQDLLEKRRGHYASFAGQLDTRSRLLQELVWEAEASLGMFRVSGMGAAYDVRIQAGGLERAGEMLRRRGLHGPVALVSDENVAPIYEARVVEGLHRAGYRVEPVVIRAGEAHKTIGTVANLWEAFLQAGLERSSTVVALGGGVVGDLAGFAAATYLRGVRWAALPTSLLAMADASLGGKTGADLPQGKNLVGAFHPPALVLADPTALETLPEAELRSGLGEVVKAGIIGDPDLFALCGKGWEALAGEWEEVVRRAMAVKVKVIRADPFEQGQRAALNLGHTIGHAIELVSGYSLRHGEAVAIGMVAEARLAEVMGMAQPGLADTIAGVLGGLGLPVSLPPHLESGAVISATGVDKKRKGGRVLFALPVNIGAVETGIEVEEEHLCNLF